MNSTKKNVNVFLIIIALSTYIIWVVQSSINPILAILAHDFPDLSQTSINMISTIVPLVSIPSILISPAIVKKLGYKYTNILALVMVVVGGVAPFFFSTSYAMIMACRVIFAIGYGIGFPLSQAIVALMFKDTVMRGRVIGWGYIVLNLASMVLASGSSALAMRGSRYAWLINLLFVIPLVFAFFVPNYKNDGSTDELGEAAEAEQKENAGGNIGIVVLAIVLTALSSLFAYALFLNSSFIIESEGLGTVMDAGMVSNLFTIGGFLIGLVFGSVFKKFSTKQSIVSMCAMFMIAFIILIISKALVPMFIASFLLGIGMHFFEAFTGMVISTEVPANKLARFNSFMVAGMNIANFSAGFLFPWLSKLFGQTGNYRFAFYPAAIFYAVVTVVLIFAVKNKPKDSNA